MVQLDKDKRSFSAQNDSCFTSQKQRFDKRLLHSILSSTSKTVNQVLLVIAISFLVSACGGGSSDSGGSTLEGMQQDESSDGDGTSDGTSDGTGDGTGDGTSDGTGGGTGGGTGENVEDAAVFETEDGLVFRLVNSGDVRGLEGSSVTLSVELEIPDSETADDVVYRWSRLGDQGVNTAFEDAAFGLRNESNNYQLTLPLVDKPTTIEFTVAVESRSLGLGFNNFIMDEFGGIENVADLSLSLLITIEDGLPNEGVVVAAIGRPAPGIAEATINDIDIVKISSDGKLAVAGTYQLNNTRANAIWVGTPQDLRLMVKTGDSIEGLPGNATFSKATTLSIATGGEIAAVADLQGAGTAKAALVSVNGNIRSLLRTGDRYPSDQIDGPISSVDGVVRTTTGAFIALGDGNRDGGGKWEWTPEGFRLVVLSNGAMNRNFTTQMSQNGTIDLSGLPVSSDGCLIWSNSSLIPSDTGSAAFSGLVGATFVIDPATFRQQLVPEASECGRGFNTILRPFLYQQGLIAEVVETSTFVSPLSGQNTLAFPGLSSEGGFSLNDVYNVDSDGSLLLSVDVLQDVGAAFGIPETRTALLKTASVAGNPVSLVAMEGETLPINFVDSIDGIREVFVASAIGNQLAVMVRQTEGTTLLTGTGHAAQPYPEIASTGSSALRYASGQGAQAPAGFPASAFFKSFSAPVLSSDGTIRFEADLYDSADNSLLVNGVWTGSADGETILRSSVSAPVKSGQRQIRIVRSDVRQYESQVPSNTSTVTANTRLSSSGNGGLLFMGFVEDTLYGVSDRAVIYMPADRSTIQ